MKKLKLLKNHRFSQNDDVSCQTSDKQESETRDIYEEVKRILKGGIE